MISKLLRTSLVFLLGFGLLGAIASQAQAQTISELPYTEDFEGVTTPDLPAGWDILENVITNSDWTEFGSDNITLQFPPNFVVGPMAILPEIDSEIDISTLEFTFSTYAAGTVDGADKMKVGFVTDHTDPSTFTLIEEFQMTNEIEEHTVSFADYDEAYGRRIAFYPESGNWNRFIIDDIQLTSDDFEPEIGTFALEFPPDGFELLVEGDPNAEVVITWERPVSNVDEDLVFTWHLDARGEDFSDPIVSIPADNDGNANEITLTVGAIDALLESLNVEVGDVVEADWTVTAEFGELVQFADAAFEIDLERGVIDTGIPLLPPADGERGSIQPFPFVFNMDTEDVDWLEPTFFPFEGVVLHRIENPDPSGLNESDFVLKYEKAEGGEPWGGFFYRLEDPIQITDESVFRLKVWSPRADIQATMKLELVAGGPASPELPADITQSGEWVELEWDLSGVDREIAWDVVTVFVDLMGPSEGGEQYTWYLDDFTLEGVEVEEPEIGTFALEFPPDGFELLVEGDPDAEVVITWERPVSNVDEDLVFTWHLDERGGDFSDPIVSIPADNDGNANEITLTVGAIDALLESLNVEVGDVVEADWTVTAEFGELVQFADVAFEIDLERGVVGELFTVTFEVNMSFATDFDPDVYDVFISGEMVGWDQPGSNLDAKMEPVAEGADVYTITFQLEAGDYEYKYFLVEEGTESWDNGEWDGPPNRQVTVTEDATFFDLFGIEPGEDAIGTFALEFPPDGFELLVEGDPDAEVVITWERPVSSDDENLVFTWHLDERGGDFSDPIVSIPADNDGNANEITLTVGAIDALLESLNVEVGDVVEADWTVTAELGDDLVQFADAAFEIDLERGVVDVLLKEFESISDLLENAEIGDEAILTNEVIVTFVAPNFRNQHYLSDETGAVLVDDNNDVLSGLSRGDGITGFTFEFSEFGGTIQLIPLEDIEPSSSGNDLPYWETTLADLEYVGEPRLMRVENVLFQQEGDFAGSTNYGIIDPTVTSPVTFRTHLGDSDVIGQPIPQGVVNLIGIADERNDVARLFAAHYDLIEEVDVEIGPFALEFPPDGFEFVVEGAFLDEVVITWERPTATVDEFLHFVWHLDAREGDFSDPIVSIPADDNGNANQITLTFEAIDGLLDAAGLDVGDVLEADWTVTAEIGTEIAFAEEAFEIDLVRGELVDRIAIVEPPEGDLSLLQPMPLVFNMDTDVVDWTGFTLFPFSQAQLARIPNPDQSGLNETDFVLEYVKPEGAEAWAGFFYLLEEPVYVTNESTFRLKVWSPRADIQTIMKLEGPEGATTGDLFADVTAAEEWVELEWDLSGQDANVAWDRVVVIMDLDENPVPTTETWYLDDFALEGVDTEPEPPFTTLFQLSALDENLPDWFGQHTERGMSAYGDNVYVVSRSDGNNVLVLDAETGEVTDSLNTEGVSGGTFLLNDVEVSGDGRIYAGNLAIGDAATFKLYELHRTRAPRVVLEYAHAANNRLGDKLTIVGNWNDGGLTLYAPDGVSAQVFKFEMNGNENGIFGAPEIIELDVVDAGSTPVVAPLPDGRFFWTASGRNVHFFEADGTHVGDISSSLAATSSTALRYLGTEGDDHLLAVYQHGHVSPVGENENVRVIRIPGGDLEEAVVEFITPSMRGATNPNGTGEVAMVPLDDGEFNLFVLGTDNGIGGYFVDALEVVFPDYSRELEFMPLAQARNLPDGRMAMVKGIVNSTDFGFGVADYFIQDETGGLNVTDFDEGGASKGQVVEPGDSIIIMGVIATFNDQRNIEVGSFEITSRGNPLPEAIVIEGADMRADSEFQGMRVQLRDMYIIEEDIDAWPEEGAATGSGVNIRITSEAEADTFIVRLARNNTAFGEGAGQPLPPAVFHITGTMGQFRQDTQLFPFFADDIVPAAEINWANLQWPPQGDIKEGEEFIVYAEVYVEGITDVSSEASDDIQAWIGVNPDNVNPWDDGWTWIEADFNEVKGNNHEYMADIGSDLTAGTYYYVSRFQLQDFDFVYGGFQGGFWDGENNVSGQLTVAEPTDADLADVPREFGIDQNYPNPFNPATNIRYAVPQTSHVTIRVYNVTGQLVATLVNETRDAGYHNVVFDGTQLASGVYIYRMQAGDFAKTRKLMLIK